MSEKLRYYNLSMSIREITNLISHNEIELDTNTSRNFIWSKNKQNLLIDSIFRNFPIPAIFLYQDEESFGKYKVIDGIQRLKTINAFFSNDLKSDIKGPLYKKTFSDLSDIEKNRLLSASVSIIVIEDIWNDDKIIEEIFYRLNLGAVSLNSQEFRNRMYSGEMINTINQLNRNKVWRDFYNKPISKRYKDSEEILKFFTLVVNEGFQGKSLNDQMNRFLQHNRNDYIIAEELASIFIEVLHIVKDEFSMMVEEDGDSISQTTFMLLFIPLGILLYKGFSNFKFKEVRYLLYSEENLNLSNRNSEKLINTGLRALTGDKNE